MKATGWIAILGLVALGACGGAGKRASVSPGAMPPNGTFTGVWYSPQYGEMHMRQSGNAVVAEYSKDERAGKIQGSVTGNLLRYTWTETRELVRGRPSQNRGRGYFKYVVGNDGRDNILGEWGIDDSEVGGGPWNAYRMKNKHPSLSSDRTGEAAAETGPDWGDAPQGGESDTTGDGLEGL